MIGYMLIAGFLSGFTLLANRLSQTILTAPMVFLGFGYLIHQIGVLPEAGTEETLHLVAEVALIVLLFLDAAQIDQRALLRRRVWPTRMLLIGLPLGFLFGVALGYLLLPGWSLAAVALIAAILVPTDAALGQPVVSNPAVPERPRRAMIVESGLNDGLALPLVLLMAAFAAPMAMAPEGGWGLFVLKQLTLGPLVGVVIGLVAGRLLMIAKEKQSTSDVYEGIGALALAGMAYLGAEAVGGNGFISAFAAGLGFGAIVRGHCNFVYEFTESEGQLLSWAAFFLLGAILVPEAIHSLTPPIAAFILLSLVLVRPLAIWISLIGTDASHTTRLFFGWFGPRGLATALFALLVADRLDPEIVDHILHLAVNAVWISAVFHGLTAAPGASWYAKRMATNRLDAEMAPMTASTPMLQSRLEKTTETKT